MARKISMTLCPMDNQEAITKANNITFLNLLKHALLLELLERGSISKFVFDYASEKNYGKAARPDYEDSP